MTVSSGQRSGTDREQLIESHLPLVRSIAKRYAGRGESVDELVQVGAIGLIRASDRFDPARGVAFASFATPAIEGEIRRHLGEQTTALRIPRDLQRQIRRLADTRNGLSASLGRTPSLQELAEALGEEVEEVERVLEAERAREPASAPRGAEEPTTPGPSEDRLLLADSARVLDERERRIVMLRFHRDLTERQIADELGISQAHVSRLLARALAKLRVALAQDAPTTKATPDPGAEDAPPQPSAPEEASRPRRGTPRAAGRKAASGSSGRFLVRMPGSLHEQLSEAAERRHVSLNRLITETLTASVSEDEEGQPGERESPGAPPHGTERFRMLLATNVIVIVLTVVAAIVLLVLALERGI